MCSTFARYLTARAVLRGTLQELRNSPDHQIRAFAVGFCTACMLMRAGRFLVDSFSDSKTVWLKLDEAELRYGIPPNQFTRVYAIRVAILVLYPNGQRVRFPSDTE